MVAFFVWRKALPLSGYTTYSDLQRNSSPLRRISRRLSTKTSMSHFWSINFVQWQVRKWHTGFTLNNRTYLLIIKSAPNNCFLKRLVVHVLGFRIFQILILSMKVFPSQLVATRSWNFTCMNSSAAGWIRTFEDAMLFTVVYLPNRFSTSKLRLGLEFENQVSRV